MAAPTTPSYPRKHRQHADPARARVPDRIGTPAPAPCMRNRNASSVAELNTRFCAAVGTPHQALALSARSTCIRTALSLIGAFFANATTRNCCGAGVVAGVDADVVAAGGVVVVAAADVVVVVVAVVGESARS